MPKSSIPPKLCRINLWARGAAALDPALRGGKKEEVGREKKGKKRKREEKKGKKRKGR